MIVDVARSVAIVAASGYFIFEVTCHSVSLGLLSAGLLFICAQVSRAESNMLRNLLPPPPLRWSARTPGRVLPGAVHMTNPFKSPSAPLRRAQSGYRQLVGRQPGRIVLGRPDTQECSTTGRFVLAWLWLDMLFCLPDRTRR